MISRFQTAIAGKPASKKMSFPISPIANLGYFGILVILELDSLLTTLVTGSTPILTTKRTTASDAERASNV